jgi:sugar O-acyltransferase (sialic acid O-acetyltransferase NeuD family)
MSAPAATAIVVIGSGGHAAVVADALLASGERVLGFTDADERRHGSLLCGLPVLGDDAVLDTFTRAEVWLANGIGGTRAEALRGSVQRGLEARGWQFASVRHPSAVVSRFARVATSVQLLAGCVVQPGAEIGEGCIVNTGAVIEHDVRLGEFVHVACGAVLCGNVQVGAHSHIGAASVVKQGVSLGAGTVVGVGAAVVKNSAGGATLVGVPADVLGQTR